MSPLRFWLTSLLAAATVTGAAALLLPYEMLAADSDPERHRLWLLTLWTAGVMAICFGGAGLIAAVAPLGFRDVAETGSVSAAVEARREARKRDSHPFYNFAGWTLATGGWLIVIYFVAWLSGA